MQKTSTPTSPDEPAIRMTGRELADALGVAPSTLSEASKTGRTLGSEIGPVHPGEWAERDDDGTVTGYLVPAWAIEELTAPPEAPSGFDPDVPPPAETAVRPGHAVRPNAAEDEWRGRAPHRSGDRTGDRTGKRTAPPLRPPAGVARAEQTVEPPPYGHTFVPPNAAPNAAPATFGLDTMREHYERMMEALERENQRLREENQRLRDELRDERDRSHREKMEAMVEQVRAEAREARERHKLREEMLELKGDLRDARAGRDGDGPLSQFFDRHGDRLFDVMEGVVGAWGAGMIGVGEPQQTGEDPSAWDPDGPLAAQLELAPAPSAERANPPEPDAPLDDVLNLATTTLLKGAPEQVEETALALRGMIPPDLLLPFARQLLLRLLPYRPEAVAANLRVALTATAPMALSFPAAAALGYARASGVVESRGEAAWVEEVLAHVQGGGAADRPEA